MEISEPSVEEMQARVARYRELKASKQAFVDTRIPEYERDIYNVIGRGVTFSGRISQAEVRRDSRAHREVHPDL